VIFYFFTIIQPSNYSIKMKTISVKKGEILQTKGELFTKIYTVESGLLRSYSIDFKLKEHIYTFAPESWLISDNCDVNEPCDLFIDAVEDSIIIVNDKEESMQIQDAISLYKRIAVLQKRIIMLMSAPALVRYQDFLITYPDIFQRIPLKMVASYIGITPEALSRVRKELSKGN